MGAPGTPRALPASSSGGCPVLVLGAHGAQWAGFLYRTWRPWAGEEVAGAPVHERMAGHPVRDTLLRSLGHRASEPRPQAAWAPEI